MDTLHIFSFHIQILACKLLVAMVIYSKYYYTFMYIIKLNSFQRISDMLMTMQSQQTTIQHAYCETMIVSTIVPVYRSKSGRAELSCHYPVLFPDTVG